MQDWYEIFLSRSSSVDANMQTVAISCEVEHQATSSHPRHSHSEYRNRIMAVQISVK